MRVMLVKRLLPSSPHPPHIFPNKTADSYNGSGAALHESFTVQYIVMLCTSPASSIQLVTMTSCISDAATLPLKQVSLSQRREMEVESSEKACPGHTTSRGGAENGTQQLYRKPIVLPHWSLGCPKMDTGDHKDASAVNFRNHITCSLYRGHAILCHFTL